LPLRTLRLTAAESAAAEHKADIARVQVPVVMLELGGEAALQLASRVATKPGRLSVGI
jgi:hypothetical protein